MIYPNSKLCSNKYLYYSSVFCLPCLHRPWSSTFWFFWHPHKVMSLTKFYIIHNSFLTSAAITSTKTSSSPQKPHKGRCYVVWVRNRHTSSDISSLHEFADRRQRLYSQLNCERGGEHEVDEEVGRGGVGRRSSDFYSPSPQAQY